MGKEVKGEETKNGKGTTKRTRAKYQAMSLAYTSTKHGINTAEKISGVLSEITKKIGSREDISPVSQAMLILNAVGKQLALVNTQMRAGIFRKGSPKESPSFFIGN